MALVNREQAGQRLRDIAQMYRDRNHPGKASEMEFAARRIEAMEPLEWTKVSDQEPPEGHYVLGWRDGECAKTRIYDHDMDGEAFWSGTVFAKQPPTHWMELPEEPEVKS